MLKRFEIVETTQEYILLKDKNNGELHRRYRALCPSCGVDRGWQKKFKQNKKCKSCSQHDKFISTLDKSKYTNVDFNDVFKHSKKTKGSETRYKTICLMCSADRGYLTLSASNKLCRKCIRKNIHNSKSEHDKYEIAKKISMKQTGEEVFTNFKTPESDKQRSIFKSKNLSKQCFERDNYTCQVCQVVGVNLHAHHLNGFNKFPEQRFTLNNLVTLCQSCHNAFHIAYGNGDNTESQFIEFKMGMV